MSARRGSVMMRLLLSVVVVASLFGVACCGDGDGGGGGGGGGGAEPPPSLYVTATANPSVVHPNYAFTVTIMVENRGQGKAENVNVYLEPSAQGYALVESCNYPSQGLAPVGLKVNIGDMFPWDSATVVVGCKATNKGATDPETGFPRLLRLRKGI